MGRFVGFSLLCAVNSGNDQCNCVLQIGSVLNLVQEFGNKRPLICDAIGQRCPSLLRLFALKEMLGSLRRLCRFGLKQRQTGITGTYLEGMRIYMIVY